MPHSLHVYYLERQTVVTAYFSSKQLLLVTYVRNNAVFAQQVLVLVAIDNSPPEATISSMELLSRLSYWLVQQLSVI